MSAHLKAPFPYFGGKSAIAHRVWSLLGDVDNYIEPFCGSAAVLLARPTVPKVETLNDLDCMIANFWRATRFAPHAVAEHCDWPVNEADLHARHRFLMGLGGTNKAARTIIRLRELVRRDPTYFDPRIAGWWVWGMCCWIGGGWCSNGAELASKRPTLRGSWNGGSKLPGVVGSRRPQLADAYSRGRGVHSDVPENLPTYRHTDGSPGGVERREWLLDWFGRLRDRLRVVRVCCGHWNRVCGSQSVTTRIGTTGVFLDPPYSGAAGRAPGLYASDDLSVAHEVRDWCLEAGKDQRMRIVLAGYEGEGHEALEAAGWTVEAWETQGGYGNQGGENVNRARERLWSSPACMEGATLWENLDGKATSEP